MAAKYYERVTILPPYQTKPHMVHKPTRIVHLISSLDQNGAQFALSRLTRTLGSPEFEHVVISIATIDAHRSVRFGDNVKVFDLRIDTPLPNPVAVWRLISILRAHRPDILQTWLYRADLLGTVVLPFVPAKLVWNIRCSDMSADYATGLKRTMLKLLARFSSRPEVIVSNSRSGIAHHQSLGYNPRRWVYAPNGFDTDVFRPSDDARQKGRLALGLGADDLAVGIAARFHKMKDYPTFFEAAHIVAQTCHRARFVVFGDGTRQETDAMRKLSQDLGIGSKIIWAGHWSDMITAFNAVDLLVMSSRYGEGFPNSVGEAMACGLPCVVTDVGDDPDLVGSIGFVSPPGEPGALARGITEVLQATPAARRERGASARQRIVTEYANEIVTQRYRELYRELQAN